MVAPLSLVAKLWVKPRVGKKGNKTSLTGNIWNLVAAWMCSRNIPQCCLWWLVLNQASGNAGIIGLLSKSCVRALWHRELGLPGLFGAEDGHPGAAGLLWPWKTQGMTAGLGIPQVLREKTPAAFHKWVQNFTETLPKCLHFKKEVRIIKYIPV